MAVTYTKAQRVVAKQDKLHLVTIDASGICFQGPVNDNERKMLIEYLEEFFKRRGGLLKSKERK